MISAVADLSIFDKGLAIGVIVFFMGLFGWAVKRHYGVGGVAETRTAAINKLAETCHGCQCRIANG